MLKILVFLAELVGIFIALSFLLWCIMWAVVVLLAVWAAVTPSHAERRIEKLRKQRVKANKERLAARNRRDAAIRKEQGK